MKRKTIFIFQIVLFGALMALVASNLGRLSSFAQPSVPLDQSRKAVSVLSEDSDLAAESFVNAWAAAGIQSIKGNLGLQEEFEHAKLGDSMWLGANSFRTINEQWLKAKYRSGVAVVVIDMPLSELAQKAGARPEIVVPDLDLSYVKGRHQISMCQEFKKETEDAFGLCYTDFVEDLANVPSILQSSIQDAGTLARSKQ